MSFKIREGGGGGEYLYFLPFYEVLGCKIYFAAAMNTNPLPVSFDVRSFLRTILVFALLSIAWTMFNIRYDAPKGDAGLGFLIIFASSFYFGRKLKHFTLLFLLIAVTIGIFLIATLVIGMLAQYNLVVYAFFSSTITSFALIFLLDKIYGMYRKYQVMLVTVVFALAGYLIFYYEKEDLHIIEKGIWLNFLFTLYQSLLLLPLAAGLSRAPINE
jgi:hypothetical protein